MNNHVTIEEINKAIERLKKVKRSLELTKEVMDKVAYEEFLDNLDTEPKDEAYLEAIGEKI